MQIEGVIVKNLGITSGVGGSGKAWKKLEFIIETVSQYPKKVAISVLGDKAETIDCTIGRPVVCHLDIESREYNNRWYTEIKAWKVENAQSYNDYAQQTQEQYQQPQSNYDNLPASTTFTEDESDDLPF